MWAVLEKDAFSFFFFVFDSDIITKLWKCIRGLIRHFNAASFATSASCRGLPPAMTKLHLQWFRSSTRHVTHFSCNFFFFIQVCTLQLPPEMNPLLVVFLFSLIKYFSSVSASIFSISGLRSQPRSRSLKSISTTCSRMKVNTLKFQFYLVLKDYSTNVPTIVFDIFGSCFNRHFNFHLCFNPCKCFSLNGVSIVLFNISGTTSTSLGFSWSLTLFKCINFSYCYRFKSSRKSEDIYNI